MELPATITPQHVVAITDTREQTPLDLAPLQSIPGFHARLAGQRHSSDDVRRSRPGWQVRVQNAVSRRAQTIPRNPYAASGDRAWPQLADDERPKTIAVATLAVGA